MGRKRSRMSTYSGLRDALSRELMALQSRSLGMLIRFFEIAKFLKSGMKKNKVTELSIVSIQLS